MPGLRIAAPAQLKLRMGNEETTGRWDDLPEKTRVSVLALLARLIAKGVVSDEDGGGDG